jgi:hypothetical protein
LAFINHTIPLSLLPLKKLTKLANQPSNYPLAHTLHAKKMSITLTLPVAFKSIAKLDLLVAFDVPPILIQILITAAQLKMKMKQTPNRQIHGHESSSVTIKLSQEASMPQTRTRNICLTTKIFHTFSSLAKSLTMVKNIDALSVWMILMNLQTTPSQFAFPNATLNTFSMLIVFCLGSKTANLVPCAFIRTAFESALNPQEQ